MAKLTRPGRLLVATGCLLAAPATGTAQDTAAAGGRAAIHGAVIAAETDAPLPGALLCLAPAASVLAAEPPSCLRTALSDSAGQYRFDRLPPGAYRLTASHIGYRAQAVELHLQPGPPLPVGLALASEPVRLPPLVLESAAGNGFDARLAGASRPTAAAAGHAEADTYRVTYEDALRAGSLGEADLLRGLRRLPGVSTRSDYTAELWTRGAPWYQTRVYFDGVPLFQPLHGLGAFTGVPAGAVGSVRLQTGVRPAGSGEAAVGRVDLGSRQAAGDGRVNSRLDLSLVGGALSLDQRVADGRAGWMLSARRTHIDWLTDVAAWLAGRPELHVPFSFADVAAAADLRVGERHTLRVSGLHASDRLDGGGDAPGRARWGSTAGRIALESRSARRLNEHALAVSVHGTRVPGGFLLDASWLPPASADRLESGITWLAASGATRPAGRHGTGAGWEATLQAARYDGPLAFSIPRPASSVQPDTRGDAFGAQDAATLELSSSLVTVAGWLDHAWGSERASLYAGLRLETGGAVRDADAVRLAPRLTAAWRLAPALALTAGLGRSYQYTQAVAPAGVHLASLSSGYLWLLAGPDAPALAVDVATLGLSASAGPVDARLAGFVRHGRGMAVPDPTPGPLLDRALWVTGSNRAAGVELSADARGERYDAHVAWTTGVSTIRAAGLSYPASSDIRHSLDAGGGVVLAPRLRVGAAYSHGSGVPYTRVFGNDPCGEGCEAVPWTGPPNEPRAPAYASLDLGLEWAPLRRLDGRLYVQLRNALGRTNATPYTDASCLTGCGAGVYDRLERGLPRLPVFGLHVRF